MVYLLALCSAGLYGAADFVGGLASRGRSALAVVAVVQAAGLLALLAVMPLLPAASPTRSDLVWGGLAGVAGGAGLGCLYRALAIGTMGIVAPVTAVCAVILPVAAGVAGGERPTLLAWSGIVLALVAIALVSQPSHTAAGAGAPPGPGAAPRRAVPPGLGLALVSGVAIGLFYLLLARTRAEAHLWPLVSARTSASILFVIVVFRTGGLPTLGRAGLTLAIAAGVGDMAANALYLLATRHGPLSTVVTLTSLYPASTVALASVLLGERFRWLQMLGIVCALVAVTLIVRGG